MHYTGTRNETRHIAFDLLAVCLYMCCVRAYVFVEVDRIVVDTRRRRQSMKNSIPNLRSTLAVISTLLSVCIVYCEGNNGEQIWRRLFRHEILSSNSFSTSTIINYSSTPSNFVRIQWKPMHTTPSKFKKQCNHEIVFCCMKNIERKN